MNSLRAWRRTAALLVTLCGLGLASFAATPDSPASAAAASGAAPRAASPAPTSASAPSAARSSTARKPAASAPVVAGTVPTEPAGYRVESAPAWVVPAVEAVDAVLPRSSVHYRVIDEQFRIAADSQVLYSHVVRVPTDSAGLASASQIAIDFDPSFQSLALHHLLVVRGGERLDRLDRTRIQLLHRETQLERQMVDGRMTLSLAVADVRPGDEVDFAYSIHGANPVFGGRFVHSVWMTSQRGPVALYQLRLLAPAARTVYQSLGSPDMVSTSRVENGQRETLIRRTAIPQFRVDPQAPGDAGVEHTVQFSEFSDWMAVAQWGADLFAATPASPLVARKAADIKARANGRDAVIREALDVVQKELRYFATEIGPNSHRPATPEQVMAQRFGDCKDKVGVFIALLRELGIAATPVLVSTSLRDATARMLPSPLAFDHVIARIDAAAGEAPLWLDATRGHQTGDPARRQVIGLGKGLVLARESTGLAALPAPYDSERMSVRDLIRLENFQADPTLESRVTYRGDLAEIVREAIALRGIQDLASEIAATYLRVYPKARATAPAVAELGVHDDTVTLVQRFAIGDFWRFPEQRVLVADIVHWSLIDALTFPKSESRRNAFGYAMPGIYRHRVAIEYPQEVFISPREQNHEDGDSHVNVKSAIANTLDRIEYGAELRIATDRVMPADWSAYTALLAKLSPRLATSTGLPALSTAQVETLTNGFKALDEQLAAKRITATTEVQKAALFKAAGLSAQIAGGRLPPTIAAQALTQRGIQYDHLGRIADAGADFARAMTLAPEATDTLNAAAVNAFLGADLAGSIALSNRALAKSAGDPEALHNRAIAQYLAGDYAGSRADLETVLKDSAAVRRGYPLIWLALAARNSGGDTAALAGAYPAERLSGDWPRPVIDLLLGRTGQAEVLRAARDGKGSAEKLCEAWFYLGELHRAEGRADAAREAWQQARDQGVIEFIEDGAARLRLAAPKAK